MTVGAAMSVNTLLRFLLDSQVKWHPPHGNIGTRPTVGEVLEAGAELARRAHKTLMAGISEDVWREEWTRKVTP